MMRVVVAVVLLLIFTYTSRASLATSNATWLDELRTQTSWAVPAAKVANNASREEISVAVSPPAKGPVSTPGHHLSKSLLISCLVFEEKKFIRQTLRNVLLLTQPSSSLVIHFSALTKPHIKNHTDTSWWTDGIPERRPGRILINPERRATRHATGTVLLQHLNNLGFARSRGLISSHVLLHASTSRLISPGVESFVFEHDFALTEKKGWLSVDIWNRKKCEQHGFRGVVKGMAGVFMCSLAYELFEVRGAQRCPSPPGGAKGVRTGSPSKCNRMLFSQHEGYFLATEAAYAALDFFKSTPIMNLSSGRPSSTLTMYDYLPIFEATGGQAAEEVWLQTFIGYHPPTRLRYEKSTPLPAIDSHWTMRTSRIGICQALAILELRNPQRCEHPFSIKRWGNLEQTGMVENDLWLECIGQTGKDIIAEWEVSRGGKYQNWTAVALSCFEKVNKRTRFAKGRSNPKCDRSDDGKRLVVDAVYKRGEFKNCKL